MDAISISDLEISAGGVDVWIERAELGKGDILGCHQCSQAWIRLSSEIDHRPPGGTF